MFRAHADPQGPYTIHRDSCLRVERRITWRGPYDTLLEACVPAVKHRVPINLCKICRPLPEPDERDHLKKLVDAFGANSPDEYVG